MSESQICPHARQAARDAFRGETEPPQIPEDLPAFDTQEAYALESKIKPYYYGKLGQAIGMIATNAMEVLPAKPLNWRMLTPWSRLASDMHSHFIGPVNDAMKDNNNGPLFDELDLLLGVRRQLVPGIHPSLRGSLEGGSGGYAVSSVHQLRLMKRDAAQLGVGSGFQNTIFRRSHGQMRGVASTNEMQFQSLRTAIGYTRMPEQQFNRKSNVMQLAVPLDEIRLEDAHPGIYVKSPKTGDLAETIGDIQAKTETVGCPILLTPKLTEQLWNYTIDAAEDRRLI